MKSNYNKFPSTKIKGFEGDALQGYEAILAKLKATINKDNFVLTVDTYPGVDDQEVLRELEKLQPALLIPTIDLFKDEQTITEQMKYTLTDNRVFGKMYAGEIFDFMDLEKLDAAKQQVKDTSGLIIVYGFGAALINRGDALVYLDLARWEIQLRFRKGLGNYKASNYDEDILRKYKRSFFIEWRIADKHKVALLNDIDYLLDTNIANEPKMISGDAFRGALKQVAKQPFRMVPYFDEGIWGGTWMEKVCDLKKKKHNMAWCFDGVMEENSLLFDFDGITIEVPAIDLPLSNPISLLGEKVYSRFGAEYPIRFNFLDTMGGGNLSLQVHPVTEYIKKEFGMTYTQDESYYILDADEGAHVYLGVKENIDKEEMFVDLKKANAGGKPFNATKYINKIDVKKHDHILIPSGTIHCSGDNAMVLEISATPYIFTFKLWDWGRVGLDGLPRPVNLEHGKKVIQWDRTTNWINKNLVNDIYEVERTNDYVVEHTGLHELEFIETRRYWTKTVSNHDSKGTCCTCNLIKGREAIVESLEGKFDPMVVHYAETFIIPADAGKFTIKPCGESVGEEIGIMKAYVRNTFA